MQVHNLPVGFMSPVVGTHLANYIGQFVEYDASNNTSIWRNYMRLRVRIDVRQPLKKGHQVRKTGGAWCPVVFRYERLGMFCFVCGCLGHTEQKCEVLFAKDHDDGSRDWGVELRADLRRVETGPGAQWLKEERGGKSNPTSGGGGSASSNLNSHDLCNQSGPGDSARVNKGKGKLNDFRDNNGALNTTHAESRILVHDSRQEATYSDGPTEDLAGGRKRSRGENMNMGHAAQSEYYSTFDNPLANDTKAYGADHFLGVGPGGSQAHQAQ